jgi:hypothetical protein
MTEVDVSAFAALSASLDGFTAEMRAARLMQARAAADCWYVEAPAIGPLPIGAPFSYAAPGWGPNTGYCWAVQRITVQGFGADSDNVIIYRGHTVADIQPQNALYELPAPGYLGVVTWHPGRVGLVLMPDESLVFSGTLSAGANAAISIDVIQVTLANLPALLL